MTPKDIELRNGWRKELEKYGSENIRIMLSNQTYIPNIDRAFAWEWLQEQDKKRLTEGQRYAKWNLILTVVAAIAGIVAAVTGILALLSSGLRPFLTKGPAMNAQCNNCGVAVTIADHVSVASSIEGLGSGEIRLVGDGCVNDTVRPHHAMGCPAPRLIPLLR